MLVKTFRWLPHEQKASTDLGFAPDLLLYFGTRSDLADGKAYDHLRAQFPAAKIVGCTTGGQIFREDIIDDEISAAAVKFDNTQIKLRTVGIEHPGQSRQRGVELAQSLAGDGLAAVFILSDGLKVNGSQLIAGVVGELPSGCAISGGLAGDGANFQETLVSADCRPQSGLIAGIGFYGSQVRVGHGCSGGWDVFGPKRRVTKSEGNVLYELDGEPALDLYERYLGPEEAERLPSSALLYPLQFVDPGKPLHALVRTVLAVDRDKRCMTFAGDLPNGSIVQLMRGNMDHVASAGAQAGDQASVNGGASASLSLLVSCIGRRLILGQRAVDEVEACLDRLATPSNSIGFYSYGEIAPHPATGQCDLHNQTMTVTTIAEI